MPTLFVLLVASVSIPVIIIESVSLEKSLGLRGKKVFND
jgi:hypothetical protein